jgi:DedD protein
MIRDFSREELEPVPAKNDTELTLGFGTILGLGLGFLLVCGTCFGVGYTAGRRASSRGDAEVFSTAARTSAAAPAAGSKPGASGQAALPPQTASTVAVPDRGDEPAGEGMVAEARQHSQADAAIGVKSRASAEAESGSGLRVQPATAQVQGWMVQIAAVSRAEDAEVLVDALRKRGYSVTARRELGDNLVHVQTGPFVNRNDANAMRQKLLGDGYNAIIQ